MITQRYDRLMRWILHLIFVLFIHFWLRFHKQAYSHLVELGKPAGKTAKWSSAWVQGRLQEDCYLVESWPWSSAGGYRPRRLFVAGDRIFSLGRSEKEYSPRSTWCLPIRRGRFPAVSSARSRDHSSPGPPSALASAPPSAPRAGKWSKAVQILF